MSATISNSSQPDSTKNPRYRPTTRNPLFVRNRLEELRARDAATVEDGLVTSLMRHIRTLSRRIAVLEEALEAHLAAAHE